MELLLYFAAIVIVMLAQSAVQGAYRKYSQISTYRGMTGAQVARQILDRYGCRDVEIEYAVGGTLSDHYDPKRHIVRLSPDIHDGDSIASVSVAAHECGHAIQHAENYGFIALRNTILPFAMVSSQFSWIVLFGGLMLDLAGLFYLGILMLSCVALFQLATLPLELDASSRAMKIINDEGFVMEDERADVKAMLTAAAFTYIAALLSSLLQIFRMIIRFNRNND